MVNFPNGVNTSLKYLILVATSVIWFRLATVVVFGIRFLYNAALGSLLKLPLIVISGTSMFFSAVIVALLTLFTGKLLKLKTEKNIFYSYLFRLSNFVNHYTQVAVYIEN